MYADLPVFKYQTFDRESMSFSDVPIIPPSSKPPIEQTESVETAVIDDNADANASKPDEEIADNGTMADAEPEKAEEAPVEGAGKFAIAVDQYWYSLG